MNIDNEYIIIDNPLPVSQNFKLLKEEALSYIQEYSGNEWTNLNPSDPGITILDQLCFAFTELGYCNHFSIEDILTRLNGKILYKNQFYLPEEILTTAPVTINDYRKYVIDGVSSVENLLISKVTDFSVLNTRIYRTHLLIDPNVTNANEIEEICKEVFYYLNKSRNLSEMFLEPVPLIRDTYNLKGTINIDKNCDLSTVISAIQIAVANYIFPSVYQYGYYQLATEGVDTDEIFNGPQLNNGWIKDGSLGIKTDALKIRDLAGVIEAVKGVTSVSGLLFQKGKSSSSDISCLPSNILNIDINTSYEAKELQFYSNGKERYEKTKLLKYKIQVAEKKNVTIPFGTSSGKELTPPKGKFRDINSYYSIQNTFPEIFSVGLNTIDSNATDFKIAQSRQLKGYLTLFDQVLANQFSQLANIDQLFSFKNAVTGTPSDEFTFYSSKDDYERKHLEYPVPYRIFSPTYFYQSLYEIPHIKPLLKDNTIYDFANEPEPLKKLKKDSWVKYKEDPYNAYIHGLLNMMEDEQVNLERRNEILDHLLARHGESPVFIDMIIEGSKYSGNNLMDKVIFKSLYLQNISQLSYNRLKAYNYAGANKILSELEDVPDVYEGILLGMNEIDFVINTEYIDQIEKLNPVDFINFSAVELKLNLLLGFKTIYKDYITNSFEDSKVKIQAKQAYWLIKNQKGMICLESGLLFQTMSYRLCITNNPSSGSYWITDFTISYTQLFTVFESLKIISDEEIAEMLKEGELLVGSEKIVVNSTSVFEGDFQPISKSGYYFSFNIEFVKQDNKYFDDVINNDIEFFFPAYIPQLNTKDFKDRLQLSLENFLPVQVNFKCHFLSEEMMNSLIKLYTKWHNEMIIHEAGSKIHKEIDGNLSYDLLNLIMKIYKGND